ncbi:MAG: peptidoglycan-binding protein [Clostridiales bacterium]|nr:peptidoglycan-binding protein [Clostridiales bacterium]
MGRIQSEKVAEQAERLREYAKAVGVPYVAGGMSLAGMDCQGLCEYLLIECGVPRQECNLSGSNAHWRACAWRGTPEECTARFGRVPAGAWVFIVNEDDSSASEKYRGDGLGDANHMGVVLKDCAIHASASRGCVAESRFEGKTIRNGGWNRVGLPPWVAYGLDAGSGLADSGANDAGGVESTPVSAVDVSGFYRIKRGCLGGAVRRLQGWLTGLGYDIGPHGVDGDFGADTEAAVLQFQREHGLKADGIVGRKTWSGLARARAAAYQNRE